MLSQLLQLDTAATSFEPSGAQLRLMLAFVMLKSRQSSTLPKEVATLHIDHQIGTRIPGQSTDMLQQGCQQIGSLRVLPIFVVSLIWQGALPSPTTPRYSCFLTMPDEPSSNRRLTRYFPPGEIAKSSRVPLQHGEPSPYSTWI